MMKKSLIAGAALAALAGFAQAQSVTIYGIVDVGVEHNSNPNGGGSLNSVQNGGIAPSIWGFRGSEDLGGGLKAVFNLEGDFNGDTGGPRFGGDLMLFGRQANVGLSGDFGTVLLGRQYSPAIMTEIVAGTDPRGYKESFSSLVPYAFVQAPGLNLLRTGPNSPGVDSPGANAGSGALAGNGSNFVGIFNGNSISYSNNFGPVGVRLGYGFGEQAGHSSYGNTFAGGLTFNAGIAMLSATYQQIKQLDSSNDKTQYYSLGAAVPLGMFTVKVHWAGANEKDSDVGPGKISKTNLFSAGVDIKALENNTITVAGYLGKQRSDAGVYSTGKGKTKSFVISNDYALSKRTTLYAQFVHDDTDSDGDFRLSIAADRGAAAGEKQNIFGLGVKHAF